MDMRQIGKDDMLLELHGRCSHVLLSMSEQVRRPNIYSIVRTIAKENREIVIVNQLICGALKISQKNDGLPHKVIF
jgi:hypothetical protein